MAGRVKSILVVGLLLGGVMLSWTPASEANSTVVDLPGFKMEKKRGWFGRKSTVYQDALGNRVERRRGLFGRKSAKTQVFGSMAVQKGRNIKVTDPSGRTLLTRKKRFLRGEETYFDGNGVVQSVKDLLKE